MRPIISYLAILAVCWTNTAGRALAEEAPPDATKVSADDRARLVGATMSGSASRTLINQRMGTRVTSPGVPVAAGVDRSNARPVAAPSKGEHLDVAAIPELDPNAAGLALALLVGGALLLVDRRRRNYESAPLLA